MGISLDCHGQSPRNDVKIATSRADSRNDGAGILLPTRIVGGVGTEYSGWAWVLKIIPATWESVFWGGWCVRVR